MGTVHVGVRHDNDGVVTQLVRIEFALADTATKGSNQRAYFGAGQHLVEACLFHIQDLTFQRQNGLGTAIAALLGRATGGVTLHQVEFR